MSEATLTPSRYSAGSSAAAAASTALAGAVSSAAGVPAAQPVRAKMLAVARTARPANLEIDNFSPIGMDLFEHSSDPNEYSGQSANLYLFETS
jgi:hypothetical protein